MTIKKDLRIRRTDNEWAKAQKILYIIGQMVENGMKIKAIQWEFKMIDGMTLSLAYSAVHLYEYRIDD